jgi:hypothetical protein
LSRPQCSASKLRFGDFGDHPGQFFLHQLVAGQRFVVELLAQHGVGARGFVAIHGRADHAPADAVAGLRETGERGFQSFRAGQHGGIGQRQSLNARLEVTEARIDHLP